MKKRVGIEIFDSADRYIGFWNPSMQRNIRQLGNRRFDLAVIGGGILGAGIARDAALRGLSVALIEQQDYGSGTSSRSTKLVHGGLRYLEQWAFSLVAESCRERGILLDMAPHLVKLLPFLLPVYDGDPRSLTKIRLGTTLYKWLSRKRTRKLAGHRTLSPEETLEVETALNPDGLRGAVQFFDCQMNDARLCLETVLDAEKHGAVCCNYTQITGMKMKGPAVDSLEWVDRISGDQGKVEAKFVVNACGPWVEQMIRQVGFDQSAITLSPTKGVHLVIPKINRENGIYFQSRLDRRMIFLLPWGNASLLGTTDTDYSGDPGAVYADAKDVQYLLQQLATMAPQFSLNADDVIASFAGVRALVRSGGRPSSRSREERLVLQADNLLTVAGGKFTTFRAIAEQAVNRAMKEMGAARAPCRTSETPLEDRRPSPQGQAFSIDDPPVGSRGVFASDVLHACRHEQVVTLADVMRRRTTLALGANSGDEVITQVSHLVAQELSWSDGQRAEQVDAYQTQRELNQSW